MDSATAWPPGPAGPSSKPGASRAAIAFPPEREAPAPARIWRIRDRATFVGLRTPTRRVKRGPVTVSWIPGEPTVPPRVAYAIGRAVGPAVVRNRLRRRLRAIVSDQRSLVRSGAYLIGAAPAAAALSWGELRAIVSEAISAVSQAADDREPSRSAKGNP